MKRKILSLTMLIALAMTTLLAACGSNDVPANAIVDTPAPTISPTPTLESSSPEVDDKEDGIVSSGTLDEIPDANEEGNEKFSLGDYDTNGIRTVYTELFAEGTKAEAWLQEHHFENPNYSYYITYFKNGTPSADEMSFTWVGPVGIGEWYWLSESETTFYVESDNRNLVMWTGGKSTNESQFLKNYDVDTIMGVVAETPIVDTYQVVEDNESTYRVIFKVTTNIDGVDFVGYACFFDIYETMYTYQFEYLMAEDVYSEAEAIAVVNSIQYVNLDDLGIIVEE